MDDDIRVCRENLMKARHSNQSKLIEVLVGEIQLEILVTLRELVKSVDDVAHEINVGVYNITQAPKR